MKYVKNPIQVWAIQWYILADHDYVEKFDSVQVKGDNKCKHCDKIYDDHGYIETLEGGHIVCPGDFIITGVRGEHYPCKKDIFFETYTPVEESHG